MSNNPTNPSSGADGDEEPDPNHDGGWLYQACLDVVEVAVAAQLCDDPEEGQDRLFRQFEIFADAIDANGQDNRAWFQLAFLLTNMVVAYDREYFAQGAIHGVRMVDQVTGTPVHDPDAEVSDDPVRKASLAVMRMIAALGNDDKDAFTSVLLAATDDDTWALVLALLARLGAMSWIEEHERIGALPAHLVARYHYRQLVESESAPPEPELRISKDGRKAWRTVTLPSLPPDMIAAYAPHGDAIYAMALYPLGDQDARAEVISEALSTAIQEYHAEIPDEELCGVTHYEECYTEEIPEPMQAVMRREIAYREKMSGVPWQGLRIWQHRGPCPADA